MVLAVMNETDEFARELEIEREVAKEEAERKAQREAERLAAEVAEQDAEQDAEPAQSVPARSTTKRVRSPSGSSHESSDEDNAAVDAALRNKTKGKHRRQIAAVEEESGEEQSGEEDEEEEEEEEEEGEEEEETEEEEEEEGEEEEDDVAFAELGFDDESGVEEGGEEEVGDYGDEEEEAAEDIDARATQGIEQMPGWTAWSMGQGVTGKPPIFETGLDGVWTQIKEDGPVCGPGTAVRDVRTEKLFVPIGFFAKGASCIGEWETQSDTHMKARSVAVAALLGMMATGTAKGWINSDEHCELQELKANPNLDDDEFKKQRSKLHGNLQTNTYFPNRKSERVERRGDVAMQYCWILEEAYDVNENLVGIWFYKLIFDASFSSDEHWRLLMEENREVARHGTINSVSERLRNSRMQQQNKLQRTQMDPERMDLTALNQYKRVKCVSDLHKFYKIYGGASESSPGRPLYANISRDTPPGCEIKPLARDDEWGGKHPLGPSVAFNAKRYQPATENDPGVNVGIAGTLDAKNQPIDIHPEQRNPTKYWDGDGNFSPPEWVKRKGAMWICHDPSLRNIFKAPFPRTLHGSVVPDDCLLKRFWDLEKDKNPALIRARKRGRDSFEHHRDMVVSLFHQMEDALDPEQERACRAVFETGMLGADSLDKSAVEEEQMEYRAYGKQHVERQGDLWVVEQQQVLKDIACEQVKGHEMVEESDKLEREEIKRRRIEEGDAFDVKKATLERQERHAESVNALVCLGLQRYENAYSRKKVRRTIPPGYYDICHTGLKEALRKAGEIANRRTAMPVKNHIVDPNDTNASVGTANLAFAHGLGMVATDRTPFGHWRSFLMGMFSAGCKIAGDDVKLMYEIWQHAFEPFQEVSFFYLM